MALPNFWLWAQTRLQVSNRFQASGATSFRKYLFLQVTPVYCENLACLCFVYWPESCSQGLPLANCNPHPRPSSFSLSRVGHLHSPRPLPAVFSPPLCCLFILFFLWDPLPHSPLSHHHKGTIYVQPPTLTPSGITAVALMSLAKGFEKSTVT